MYIYESHETGDIFFTERYLEPEECYCETCGDSDRLAGSAENIGEAERAIRAFYMEDISDGFIEDTLKDIRAYFEDYFENKH